jgi:hypothetical protein
MSGKDEKTTTGEVPKRFCPDGLFKRLEAAGYVRLDSFRWERPQDIPVMAARRKIKRARQRRALFATLIAEARAKKESGSA